MGVSGKIGLGGKKTKTTESQTLGPNAAYAPAINAAAAKLSPAYDKSMSIFDSYQPGFNAARGYTGDVLAGKYLDHQNPYLDSIAGQVRDNVTNDVNGQFSLAGRYGSGQHAGILAKQLADAENQLRFGAYNTERGYQQQAPGQMAQLATVNSSLPQAIAGNYANSIGDLLGKYIQGNATGTSKTSGGFLGDLILASIAGASKAASMGG